ncbi:MAG: hypothetical protein AAF687_07680 [Pseudomonadota bacterium]
MKILVCVAALTVQQPAFAQSEPPLSRQNVHDAAACLAMDRIVNDMRARWVSEQKWIRENRARSGSFLDEFNRRVNESNALVKYHAKLNDEFKAKCGTMVRAAVDEVCSAKKTKMRKYLRDAPNCVRIRGSN